MKTRKIIFASAAVALFCFIVVVASSSPGANFSQLKPYQQVLAVLFYIAILVLILSSLVYLAGFLRRKLFPAKKLKSNQKVIYKTPVARKYKVLYAYVIVTVIVQQPLVIYQIERSHSSSTAVAYPTPTIILFGLAITLNLLINLYLITTHNLSRLVLVLKILLILQVIGFISLLFRDINSYNFIISLLVTPLTYYTYAVVSGKKQQFVI